MTSAQLRAARGLLNWTVRELSAQAGVHRNTITRAEIDGTAHGHAVAQLARTLEAAGVEFIAENDVVSVSISLTRLSPDPLPPYSRVKIDSPGADGVGRQPQERD